MLRNKWQMLKIYGFMQAFKNETPSPGPLLA